MDFEASSMDIMWHREYLHYSSKECSGSFAFVCVCVRVTFRNRHVATVSAVRVVEMEGQDVLEYD